MKINNEIAIKIADEFLREMNPEMWGGQGERPSSFDTRIWVMKDISPDYPGEELNISFDYDDKDGWLHLVELVDTESNVAIDVLHGYGVDSPQNIADTISDLLKDSEITKQFLIF